jgi:hypothetical protein
MREVSRLAISRRLAYAFGVLTPLAETIRRWGTWWVNPPAFVDDFILGAFLIAGAWATRNPHPVRGRILLAAAWGFACGMAYSSAAFHWAAMRAGQLDPAPIPSHWVFAIKIAGGVVFVAALVLTLTADQRRPTPE